MKLERISDEQLDNLEWIETPSIPENYMADFTFIDDYRKEVHRILDAQLASCQQQLDDRLDS